MERAVEEMSRKEVLRASPRMFDADWLDRMLEHVDTGALL